MRRNNKEVALTRRGNNALVRHQAPREEYLTPVADIFETPDSFVLKLDMPGVDKESLMVSAEPLLLTIKGPVLSRRKESVRILMNEISTKKLYYRQFHLTSGLDHSRIQAEFDDGILTISIPKTDDMKLKEIPIQ